MSAILMQSLFVMGTMAALGFIMTRLGFIKPEDAKTLSRLNLYLISPCVTINAFQMDFTADRVKGLLLTLGAGAAIQLVMILIHHLLSGPLHLDGVELCSADYSNAGNLLVPLVQDTLGAEYVLYTCSYRTFQQFLMWTHGVKLLDPKQKISLKKLLLNPNIVALLFGLFLFFTGIRLPGALGTAVARIGGVISPTCMLSIGIIMAGSDLKTVFTKPKLYMVTACKLLLCPAVMILLIRVTGAVNWMPDARALLLITLLAAAAPVANNVAQMARLFGADAEKAGALNVLTMLLAIGTMPLMTYLYQVVC